MIFFKSPLTPTLTPRGEGVFARDADYINSMSANCVSLISVSCMKFSNACKIQVLSLFLFCSIISCGGAAHIDYTPDLSNVIDPVAIIKATLERQPPAYASIPEKVDVTDRSITMYVEESEASFLSVFSSNMTVVPKNYYFKNLGIPKLFNSPIWSVVLYDNSGYYLYCVYVHTEMEAKEFMNALAYMIEKNR